MYFPYTNIDKDDNHVINLDLWYSDRILATGLGCKIDGVLDPTFPPPKVDRYSVRIYGKVIL